MHAQQQIEVDLRRLRHQGECERPVGRWRAVGATGSWMPVPGSLDPLTSTTEELCGCLGRGSTGPSSRAARRARCLATRRGRWRRHGSRGASLTKGRLGGRLRQQRHGNKQPCRGRNALQGRELRRNVRAVHVHEQHSQLFRALAQFSSSGNAASDSSAAPARAHPPPAPLRQLLAGVRRREFRTEPRAGKSSMPLCIGSKMPRAAKQIGAKRLRA